VKKKISTGREDVHPQNGLNGLILNWCIGGCWFTPAPGPLHWIQLLEVLPYWNKFHCRLSEPISLVKVFRLFRLEPILHFFKVFRNVDKVGRDVQQPLIYWQGERVCDDAMIILAHILHGEG
jgi:hypothetical protein